jgi:hypothetical protein
MQRTGILVISLFMLSTTLTAQAGRPPWDDTKKPPPAEKKGEQKPPDKQGSK